MSWTSQRLTRNHKPKRNPVAVVDIAGTFLFKYPLLLKGDLEIGRMLYGANDPERCRGGVYGTNDEASVSGPEKVDRLRARQPNPIARIWGGILSFVGRVCTRWIQLATPDPYPIISNFNLFALLFGGGAWTQLDSAMRVIDVWHAYHWCFVMSVIAVWHTRHWCLIMSVTDGCRACLRCFQACHQCIQYICCMVTRRCIRTCVPMILSSTS